MNRARETALPPDALKLMAEFRENYFSVKQTAILLGRTPMALQKMRDTDRGPPFYRNMLSKQVFYKLDDLREYMMGHLVRNTQAAEQQEKADAG